MHEIVAEDEGFVRIIRINRPERLNALNPTAFTALREALIAFRDDPSKRIAIVTGTGARAFCTGADLKDTLPQKASFASTVFQDDATSIENGNYIRGIDIERIGLTKPLIAAINGHAIGGGLELALACDIRLCSEEAKFGLSEVRIGSIPAVGGIQNLIRTVPQSLAMTMILGGELIDANRAERCGLVSERLPASQLMARAKQLATTIAENGPLAVQAARMLALKGRDMTIPHAMLLEQFAWGILRDTYDRIEGRVAFAEKRPPVFEGR